MVGDDTLKGRLGCCAGPYLSPGLAGLLIPSYARHVDRGYRVYEVGEKG